MLQALNFNFSIVSNTSAPWTDRFVANKINCVAFLTHYNKFFSFCLYHRRQMKKKTSKSQSIEMACVSAIKQRTFSYQRSIRQFLIFEGLSQNSFFLQSLFILVVFHRNGKNLQTWKTLNNHSDG